MQIRRSRVTFDGNLRIILKYKPFPQQFQYPADPLRLQNGRCATAEENRTYLICFCIRETSDFLQQSCSISLLLLPASRPGQKITIRTFFHTKWNVYINLQISFFLSHCFCSLRSFLFSIITRKKTAAKFCSAAAPHFNLFVVQFQYAHECLLRNLYITDLAHTLFTFLLFFQKFSLT